MGFARLTGRSNFAGSMFRFGLLDPEAVAITKNGQALQAERPGRDGQLASLMNRQVLV